MLVSGDLIEKFGLRKDPSRHTKLILEETHRHSLQQFILFITYNLIIWIIAELCTVPQTKVTTKTKQIF